jgi:hypothetical protein
MAVKAITYGLVMVNAQRCVGSSATNHSHKKSATCLCRCRSVCVCESVSVCMSERVNECVDV